MNTEELQRELADIRIPDFMASDLYQFSLDIKASETMGALPPVNYLAEQLINVISSISVGSSLMQAVKVGPDQFSWIHMLGVKAAMVLHTDLPPIFVKQDPQPNAYTFGVNEQKASIVLTSALLDIVTPRELLFVIGHELGHFQCKHVLYHMLAKILSGSFKFIRVRNMLLDLALKAASVTAGLAVYAWARRSEVSADRAGLITCQSYDAAASALAKLSAGVAKEKINIEAYLRQLEEVREQWSGIMVQAGEVLQLHPYLPKRIEALRLFQDCHSYVDAIGGTTDNSITHEQLDERISTLLFSGEREA